MSQSTSQRLFPVTIWLLNLAVIAFLLNQRSLTQPADLGKTGVAHADPQEPSQAAPPVGAGAAPSEAEAEAAALVVEQTDTGLGAAPSADLGGIPLAEWGPAPDEGSPGPLNLEHMQLDEASGRIFADLGEGWYGEATLDAGLQARAQRLLRRTKMPVGAAVLIDVRSGEILAMAEHHNPAEFDLSAFPAMGPEHLALRAIAPAASIFKIVSAAALLEAQLNPNRAYAYLPSSRLPEKEHLGKLGPGAPTATLKQALAHSNNGYFARMANDLLDRDHLNATAHGFGFSRGLNLAMDAETSPVTVPNNKLERARMAAGFYRSYMSPLHAALIATTVARDGELIQPHFIRSVISPSGYIKQAPESAVLGQAYDKRHARTLKMALSDTTRTGTARKSWRHWPAKLSHIKVGSKTGTLNRKSPRIASKWFVAFAPLDEPEVAVAVLQATEGSWVAPPADVARDLLAYYFLRPRPQLEPLHAPVALQFEPTAPLAATAQRGAAKKDATKKGAVKKSATKKSAAKKRASAKKKQASSKNRGSKAKIHAAQH